MAVATVILIVVAVLAFMPDPRQRVWATTFNDVDGVLEGAPVYFRGAAVGDIRSIRLDPESRTFAVRLGVRRDLTPAPCMYARVVAPLPVTAPRVEIEALNLPAPACAAERAKVGCEPMPAPDQGGTPIVGCRRDPDLLKTATASLADVTELVRTANAIAKRLEATLDGAGPKGEAQAARQLMASAEATLDAANRVTTRLDATLAPGGDGAASLANLRRASAKAADIDIARLNAAIADLQTLVQDNQAAVKTLLDDGTAVSAEARALLQNVSATLSAASANLERASDNAEALSERLSDDPTFAVRGQRYQDPPPVGGP